MAYKTVRRNGRDILINTVTGKEVPPGQRVGNELTWLGKGITDNFTYSDKVDARSGRRLTPAEVRRAEGSRGRSSQRGVPATPNSKRDPEFRTNGGWTGDPNSGRTKSSTNPQSRRPASTQPNNSSTSSRRSNSGGTSSSTSSPRTSSPTSSASTPSKIPTANETYRDGGKGLYQGTQEYRNKVGGSGNPLLNRFRKDMGRDEATGDKPSNITPSSTPKPGSATVKNAPNGKEYYGPAYGERSGPAAPASPNSKPDVGYNPKPIKAPDYSSSKTTNRNGTAFSAKQNLLDELRKRRTGR